MIEMGGSWYACVRVGDGYRILRIRLAIYVFYPYEIADLLYAVVDNLGQPQGKRILNTFKINTKQSIVFKNLKKH